MIQRPELPAVARPSTDEYYMNIARSVARRSTCPGASVGAVLVDERDWSISTGYNGAPTGCHQCDQVGCAKDSYGHCIRTVHAELNALLRGKGDTLYVTHFPCIACCHAIINRRILRVVWEKPYIDRRSEVLCVRQVTYLESAGILVDKLVSKHCYDQEL